MTNLPEVGIDYLTEDEDEKELCRCYWLLDEYGEFRYTLAELALNFRLKPSQVNKKVAQYSRAYIKKSKCSLCGIPTHFLDRRNDFYKNKKVYEYQAWENPMPYLCKTCQYALEKRQAEKAKNTASENLKSIFPTPQHLQFFKNLRREEYFVYPQLAIFTFVDDAFLYDYHELAKEVVSFLVCDGQGKPQQAIDFVLPTHVLHDDEKEVFYQKEELFKKIGLRYRIAFP